MSLAGLLGFAAAYLAIVVHPCAAFTALVARVLARGTRGAPAFVAGITAGSLVRFTVAATFSGVLVVVRYAGAAYLLYLAWKLWNASARTVQASDASPDGAGRLFLAGLGINLGNPKAMVFFLALLPTVVDLDHLTFLGFAELCGVIVLVATGVFTVYSAMAARARRLLTSPRAVRLVNRGSAMAGAAAAIAAR